MIQFSIKSDYAIRALLELAVRHPRLVKIEEVVHEQRLPSDYIAVLLGRLTRRGIVQSKRGPHGGYALARAPELITLAEVIACIEGPPAENQPASDAAHQHIGVAANLPAVWIGIRHSLQRIVDNITLAQVLAGDLSPAIGTPASITSPSPQPCVVGDESRAI